MGNDSKKTEWAIVELMGHVVIAGEISEEVKFGKSLLRLDYPSTETRPAFTQWINPDSLYRITPTTEEIAQAIAIRSDPRPAALFNLELNLHLVSGDNLQDEPDGDEYFHEHFEDDEDV